MQPRQQLRILQLLSKGPKTAPASSSQESTKSKEKNRRLPLACLRSLESLKDPSSDPSQILQNALEMAKGEVKPTVLRHVEKAIASHWILGCAKQQKKQIMDNVVAKYGLTADWRVTNSLIAGLATAGRVDEALEMARNVWEGQGHVTRFACTKILIGMCKMGEHEAAVEFLREMSDNRTDPHIQAYNVILSSLSSIEPASVLDILQSNDLRMNSTTLCILYKIANSSADLKKIWAHHSHHHSLFTSAASEAAISAHLRIMGGGGLKRRKDSFLSSILHRTQRIHPTASSTSRVYGAAIRALVQQDALPIAESIFSEARRNMTPPSQTAVRSLIRATHKAKQRGTATSLILSLGNQVPWHTYKSYFFSLEQNFGFEALMEQILRIASHDEFYFQQSVRYLSYRARFLEAIQVVKEKKNASSNDYALIVLHAQGPMLETAFTTVGYEMLRREPPLDVHALHTAYFGRFRKQH